MKGVRENIDLTWDESVYRMKPGVPTQDIITGGISFPLAINPAIDHKFSFELKLNGSRLLSFLPFAREMDVNINSTWASPSFEGAFIPSDKKITPKGFTATWKVLELNRYYGQYGIDDFIGSDQVIFE